MTWLKVRCHCTGRNAGQKRDPHGCRHTRDTGIWHYQRDGRAWCHPDLEPVRGSRVAFAMFGVTCELCQRLMRGEVGRGPRRAGKAAGARAT